jgi:hypothetical protein
MDPIMEEILSCSLASSRGHPPIELHLTIQYFSSHLITLLGINIIYARFPGLGFQVKNLCVMFVFAIVSFLFFSEYQFAVDTVQG